MIRTFALAVSAAALVSPPAVAAELSPSQVRLDGRTEAQIRADVTAVASRLCAQKYGPDDTASVEACVSDSVRATMRKITARGAYVFTVASADD